MCIREEYSYTKRNKYVYLFIFWNVCKLSLWLLILWNQKDYQFSISCFFHTGELRMIILSRKKMKRAFINTHTRKQILQNNMDAYYKKKKPDLDLNLNSIWPWTTKSRKHLSLAKLQKCSSSPAALFKFGGTPSKPQLLWCFERVQDQGWIESWCPT